VLHRRARAQARAARLASTAPLTHHAPAGCYIHQRCHNLLPRLAQVALYIATVLALAPWAFWKFFDTLPDGFNGVAGVGAAAAACAALLLTLDGIATPLAFMRKCARAAPAVP
jgi:hypothetical protein